MLITSRVYIHRYQMQDAKSAAAVLDDELDAYAREAAQKKVKWAVTLSLETHKRGMADAHR